MEFPHFHLFLDTLQGKLTYYQEFVIIPRNAQF